MGQQPTNPTTAATTVDRTLQQLADARRAATTPRVDPNLARRLSRRYRAR